MCKIEMERKEAFENTPDTNRKYIAPEKGWRLKVRLVTDNRRLGLLLTYKEFTTF